MIILQITEEQLDEKLKQAVTAAVSAIKKEDNKKSPEKYLSRRQVADALHISLVTLNTYTFSGKIPASRIGGRVLYKQSDVDNALRTIKLK